MKITIRLMFVLIISMLLSLVNYASSLTNDQYLLNLQSAYPDYIGKIKGDNVIWKDGTKMPLFVREFYDLNTDNLDNPTLYEQLSDNMVKHSYDLGRVRYLPFFKKMYGKSPQEVRENLATIYWMPNIFANKYPLKVTRVNNVDKKLANISSELEKLVFLHPEYRVYLENPGGTFCWRLIANTKRLSLHSFGMTIDLNTANSDYWQWDLEKSGKPISEEQPLKYHNKIPKNIVKIFAKYGFIWGGNWYHYDTMHFEYRPELFVNPEPVSRSLY